MEAKAQARFVRVTPQKARRVVDLIRGKQASAAVAVLQCAPAGASEPVGQVVARARRPGGAAGGGCSSGGGQQQSDDPWATAGPASSGGSFSDEPPF